MERRRNRTISGVDQRERVDAFIDEVLVAQRPMTGDFEAHAGIATETEGPESATDWDSLFPAFGTRA